MPAPARAGFAKHEDLVYFLKTICGIGYVYLPQLAPDKDLLDLFKKKKAAGKIMKRTSRLFWPHAGLMGTFCPAP